ncbi:MAG: hypothetical protein GY870_11295 [archaeon]|nr:hypothetical protein [archaeon]
MSKKIDKEKEKDQDIEDIASAMVTNMAANMKNPNFIRENELIKDEVRKKIIEKRNNRRRKQQKE